MTTNNHNQTEALKVALQNLVDCISETRGKDATEALAAARALLGTQAHRQESEREAQLDQQGQKGGAA